MRSTFALLQPAMLAILLFVTSSCQSPANKPGEPSQGSEIKDLQLGLGAKKSQSIQQEINNLTASLAAHEFDDNKSGIARTSFALASAYTQPSHLATLDAATRSSHIAKAANLFAQAGDLYRGLAKSALALNSYIQAANHFASSNTQRACINQRKASALPASQINANSGITLNPKINWQQLCP